MSGRGYICNEPIGTCELCGAKAETRPYGPKGERICWPCGTKNPEIRDRRMAAYLGVSPPLDDEKSKK